MTRRTTAEHIKLISILQAQSQQLQKKENIGISWYSKIGDYFLGF